MAQYLNKLSDSQKILVSMWVWIFFLGLSVFFSHLPNVSAVKFLNFAVGAVLVCIVYRFASKENTRKYLEAFLWVVVVFALAIALKGLYQYFVLHISRPRSMVSHPNTFAMYMELTIPLLLAQFLSIKKIRWKRILIFVVLLILVLALVITFSRGAWFATIIGALLVLWCSNGRRAVFWAVAALPILLFSNVTVYKRFLSSFDLTMQSNVERIYGLISSFKIILDYPLTGVGLGCYEFVYPSYKLPMAKEILPHAHNTLMVFATEAGIIAASAFLVFIIHLVKNLYFSLLQNNCRNERHYLLVGMSGSVLALLLHGFVDYTLGNQGVLGIFMLYVGYLLGLVEQCSKIGTIHDKQALV